MGSAYPELSAARDRVADVLKQEEERFGETLAHGMTILEQALAGGSKLLDGETAFRLYDTFGFPLDLTADVCRERSVNVDEAGFEAAMERQRDQARAAGKFRMAAGLDYSGDVTRFEGYEHLALDGSRITALYSNGSPVTTVEAGGEAIVVLDRTPFYAESGGQVGDAGMLQSADASVRFDVADTQKIQADVFGHHGRLLAGRLKVGDHLVARVDGERRARTMRNHSATHLMHKALREVLGAHVQQKGSLVDAERTRFDFSHHAPVSDDEVLRIESIVNAEVLANSATQAQVMSFDDAVRGGAMALFGEKYGDSVRVLDIGSSRELCGGTHVARTGDIGLFKVVAESGVAAGIRRIEAVTGDNALTLLQSVTTTLDDAAAALKVSAGEVPAKLSQVLDSVRSLEKEVARLKSKLAASQGDDLALQAVDVAGIKVLAARLEGADARVLRETIDQLKSRLGSAAIVLASVEGGKVSLIAGVTQDATARVKAGDLVNHVAQQVGGKGGGRADMAQAGGTQPDRLPAALAGVADWVASKAG
jgi:alanyl-tRNA synthetase